ncbi:hypothetical protein H5410_058950 [Solanum commersonii]|uniref:Uncharacterized protein n=1 Tax=Solanum commersonii TaxID=4109 RepID=A0A9J5W1F9_SOLCO|nr:hypothetical protein H5410_058950 [Solanum commersonii]
MDVLVIWFSDVIFAKIFHGLSLNYSHGASWSRWANLPIFKVKRALERSMDVLVIYISDDIFVDVRQDLSYGVGQLRQANLPIFKMSIKTLAMEPVGHDGQTRPFSRYGAGWSRRVSRPIFNVKRTSERMSVKTLAMEQKFFMYVRQDLNYGAAYFKVQTIPEAGKSPILPIFCIDVLVIRISSVIFAKTWTSVKTLAMEPGCSDGFSELFLPKFFMDVRQDLSYRVGWSRRANHPIFKVKRSPKRTLAMEPVGPYLKINLFSRSNKTRILGCFGDLDSRHHFCRNFSWTSVKNIAMQLVDHDGQTSPFSRSNDLWSW